MGLFENEASNVSLIKKMQSKKIFCALVMAFLILDIIICFTLSWNEMRIKKVDISEIPVLDSSDGVILNVEDAYHVERGYDSAQLYIKGWAVIKGTISRPVAIKVIIKNESSGTCYLLPTSMSTRPDVTDYIGDGVNYDNSGYSVHLNYDMFDFSHEKYRVLVSYTIADKQYIFVSDKFIE